MIRLITGQPGNGKTLYVLAFVEAWAKKEGRQVWYHGIKELKLDWKALPVKLEHLDGERNPETEVPQWWEAPAKSIIVIDEAQNCGWGTRPRGQTPKWAKLLETHRHMGVDIVFITQDPTLIDAHDRKLCELHFHVMRTFGMQRATIHEFRPVRENVLKSRKGSIEHRWKFPKEVYGWYSSAEAHTHKVRIPMKVVVLFSLPFVIGGLGWLAWSQWLDPHRVKPGQQLVPAGAPSGYVTNGPAKLTPAAYVAQYTPRMPGLPHTAPVYDEVTKPTQAPFPAACVQSKSRCQCYTQQGTRLDVSPDLCVGIVNGGFFVAWDRPLQPAVLVDRATAVPVAFAGPGSLGRGVVPRTSQPSQDNPPARSH